MVTPEFRGTLGSANERESSRVYAIVRCGGRQEKVALDDVVTVDKLPGEVGSSITLAALSAEMKWAVQSETAHHVRFMRCNCCVALMLHPIPQKILFDPFGGVML